MPTKGLHSDLFGSDSEDGSRESSQKQVDDFPPEEDTNEGDFAVAEEPIPQLDKINEDDLFKDSDDEEDDLAQREKAEEDEGRDEIGERDNERGYHDRDDDKEDDREDDRADRGYHEDDRAERGYEDDDVDEDGYDNHGRRREREVGPPLNLEIPLLPQLAPSNKMMLMSASNIVGLETRPFDPDTFQEGGPMNVIRWRIEENADGSTTMDSNARFVEWSDGTWQLLLNNELFAVDRQSMVQENSHLFVRHPKLGVVQGQGRLREKIKFRPVNLNSETHKKLAQGLDSKYRKMIRVKDTVTLVDPEKEKEAREKEIEARIRSQEELAKKQMKEMKKYENIRSRGPAMNDSRYRHAGYVLEDEDDDLDRRLGMGSGGSRRFSGHGRDADGGRAKRPKEYDEEMDDFLVDEDEEEENEYEEEFEEEEEEMHHRKKKKKEEVKKSYKGVIDEEEEYHDEEEVEEEEEERRVSPVKVHSAPRKRRVVESSSDSE